jgi:hypothetical protein
MENVQERRESPVLYEYCAAMAAMYKSSLCRGEARISGAAFRAACRCSHAMSELGPAAGEEARREAFQRIREIVLESLYWVWLLELRAQALDHQSCSRAARAAEELLERIDSL